MLSTKEDVLVELYETEKKKVELQKVYSRFARAGKIEDFMATMAELYKEGFVKVPYESWSPRGETTSPDDIVMTGVKLTEYGRREAQRLEQKFRELLK